MSPRATARNPSTIQFLEVNGGDLFPNVSRLATDAGDEGGAGAFFLEVNGGDLFPNVSRLATNAGGEGGAGVF